MTGFLLAGASDAHLHPLTRPASKETQPTYDKPVTDDPVGVRMLAGSLEIHITCAPGKLPCFPSFYEDSPVSGLPLPHGEQIPSFGLPNGRSYAWSDAGTYDTPQGAAALADVDIRIACPKSIALEVGRPQSQWACMSGKTTGVAYLRCGVERDAA